MNDDALLIKDAAKLLQIGSKTLYTLLHDKGYIARGNNFPRDDMVKAGYFKSAQRTRVIKRPGESQGKQAPYWVTTVTDEGFELLKGIVAEHKAATAPIPGCMKVTLELIRPDVLHALVRFATLLDKNMGNTMTDEERSEYHRARQCLSDDLPVLATNSLQRLNKKLFSHPKFQTVFQPQQTQQAH